MKTLSKSKYTKFCQCPKALWLQTYRPEMEVIDDSTQARFEQGNVVGDLAMGLFGDFVEVTARREDGGLDLGTMIERTRECMDAGVENIAEASFSFEGNYCAVDILRKTADGWAIYEVKSTTFSPEKELKKATHYGVYAPDIAYQKWVLTKCGVNVTGTFLVLLDSDYVLDGDLDVRRLFHVLDLSDLVANEYPKVARRVPMALAVVNQETEPKIDLGEHCKKPYPCAFWQYCLGQKGLPTPNCFDLYGKPTSFKKQLEFYHRGNVSFEQIQLNEELVKIPQMQVECTLDGRDHIDVPAIREYLSKLTYPLYFLDFETIQQVVPQFQGTHPYQQIPFQYSLHYIEREGGPLLHKEFLGVSGTDTRRACAESLCEDIPMGVCVLAYNKAFECARIAEMAEAFPDLAHHLLNIRGNIRDLIDPFRAGHYYTPAMGGSFSIKAVLPALFPDDPKLDYHNLDDKVQNGGDAMTIFPKIKDMPAEEQAAAREALLRYCELDTFAMVKVWEKLKEAVNQ